MNLELTSVCEEEEDRAKEGYIDENVPLAPEWLMLLSVCRVFDHIEQSYNPYPRLQSVQILKF